jgi:hypothetical protein
MQSGCAPARSDTDGFNVPARSGSPSSQYHALPLQISLFSLEMGESESPPFMVKGVFSPVATPCDDTGLDLNQAYSSSLTAKLETQQDKLKLEREG